MHAWREGSRTSGGRASAWLRSGRGRRWAMVAAASSVLHNQAYQDLECLRGCVGELLELDRPVIDHEFANDQELLVATITWLTRAHLRRQATLARLLARGDFIRWGRAALLQSRTPGVIFGCEIARISTGDGINGRAQELLNDCYRTWQSQIVCALEGLRGLAVVDTDADLDRLATAMLGLLQGGYMTACDAQSLLPLEAAMDAAARLATHGVP
jgi:hypothetical protein